MKRAHSPLDETRAARLREESELEAEFAAHVAHRVDELVAGGMSADNAHDLARAEFGDTDRLKSESRAVRAHARRQQSRASRFDVFRQDLSYSMRQLRRSPGFAMTAIATLMLGVGATVTIVSVVDAVVFEPLPFSEPGQVVFASMLTPEGARFEVAEPGFVDWSEQATSFTEMAAFTGWGATLRSPGQPRSINTGRTSHELLDVLGTPPALGRMFTAEEDISGSEAPVALISYDMWRSDFGVDPDVLGTTLDLDGRLVEVIGVMPDRLEILTGDIPVFVPLGADPNMDRSDHYLVVVARLAGHATFATALGELENIQKGLSETHGVHQGWSATISTSQDVLIGEATMRSGWILLAAAGLLLLMACGNVSNLLMVRATVRESEMGLRAALGASHIRLVRQLFTESALLAAIGGGMGFLFARFAVPVVKTMGHARIPRLDDASLDGATLWACVLSVAGASLVCGLAPIVQLRSRDLHRSIASAHRGSSDRGSRLRSLIVGAQVSMTVVLLAGTGLLMRSFVELSNIDPGFEAEGTLAVRLDMPTQAFPWQERSELVPRLWDAVNSLPGVVAVGATPVAPFSGNNLSSFVAPADRLPDRAADFTPISWRAVTPGFFDAMGMELKSGRTFVDSDGLGSVTEVVIGQALARMAWGDEDAIDRVLVWGDPEGSRLRVVGVVEDLRDVALAREAHSMVYRLYRDIPWAVMTLVARVEG